MTINGNTALKTAVVIILLLAAFLPAKYVDDLYGYLPGLVILSLLFLSLLYFLIVRRGLWFETEALETVCRRGETADAVLKIENRSVLTCPKARAFLSVADFFGGEDSVSPMTFVMNGKSETEFPFRMKMDHIGVYTFGIKMLQVYEPLGIFSITIREKKTFRITVLPRLYPADELRLEEKLPTESRNLSKNAVNDGFDYTGVREYALGDPMKRIHWKLSAHSSAYMTRVTESSRKNDLTVVLDLVPAPLNREVLPYVYDSLVETALSLIEQAKSKDIEYSLLFIGRNREIVRVMPKGEQDYESLIQMLPAFYTGPDPVLPDGAEILDKESHLGNRGTNIILCTSRVTERLLQELIAVKRQQRHPELYFVIPPGFFTAEAENQAAALEVFDESGIRYHLVIADETLQQ